MPDLARTALGLCGQGMGVGRRLRLAWSPFGLPLGHLQGYCEDKLQGDGPGGVEQHVGKGAGAVGQEDLVNLIRARDQERGGDGRGLQGELLPQDAKTARRTHANGAAEAAVAEEREDAVSGKVSAFPEVVMDEGPAAIDRRTEEPVEKIVDRTGGMVGAEGRGGFGGEEDEEEQYGEPGLKEAKPALDSRLMGIGHGRV